MKRVIQFIKGSCTSGSNGAAFTKETMSCMPGMRTNSSARNEKYSPGEYSWIGHSIEEYSWIGHSIGEYSWIRHSIGEYSWIRHSIEQYSWIGHSIGECF